MIVNQIKPQMQQIWRYRRMQAFAERINLRSGMRIIDLGGLPQMWEAIDLDLEITLVNLPKALKIQQSSMNYSQPIKDCQRVSDVSSGLVAEILHNLRGL